MNPKVRRYQISLRFQAFPHIQTRWVPKSFHSGERFQKLAVTVCVDGKRNRNKMFADTIKSGYVWTTELYYISGDRALD